MRTDGCKRRQIARASVLIPGMRDGGFVYDDVKDHPSWHTRVIQTGHAMMREAPDLTAKILEDAI